VLSSKVADPVERLWYPAQTAENGWSRSVLEIQIETRLYQRQVTDGWTDPAKRLLNGADDAAL